MSESPFASTFFFFNDTATTEIYTLSLHDALPISIVVLSHPDTYWITGNVIGVDGGEEIVDADHVAGDPRSEEHTSELQSQSNLVCRLLLEKKKTNTTHSP